MKVGDNVKLDDYVIFSPKDWIETIDGYTFYNPPLFKPQCQYCWEILDVKWIRSKNNDDKGDIAKVFKCKCLESKNADDN